jgi:hypothetical protein
MLLRLSKDKFMSTGIAHQIKIACRPICKEKRTPGVGLGDHAEAPWLLDQA